MGNTCFRPDYLDPAQLPPSVCPMDVPTIGSWCRKARSGKHPALKIPSAGTYHVMQLHKGLEGGPQSAKGELPQDISDVFAAPFSWTRGKQIGQGAFGTVYMGLVHATGQEIAVKQVGLPTSPVGSKKALSQIAALELEVALLRSLRHENIVQYLGTERTDEHLNIFLEYVAGGTIAKKIAQFGPLREETIRVFTKQILRGLEYLHQQKVMHRDIKGANILVDTNGVVKLADFGASKKIEHLANLVAGARSIHGTAHWMAPEVVKQQGHGPAADVWSLACVVVEMATGQPPWANFRDPLAVMFHVASTKELPAMPESLSAHARDFLTLCFNRVPHERPNATRLLQHPWLQGVMVPWSQRQVPDSSPAPLPVPASATPGALAGPSPLPGPALLLRPPASAPKQLCAAPPPAASAWDGPNPGAVSGRDPAAGLASVHTGPAPEHWDNRPGAAACRESVLSLYNPVVEPSFRNDPALDALAELTEIGGMEDAEEGDVGFEVGPTADLDAIPERSASTTLAQHSSAAACAAAAGVAASPVEPGEERSCSTSLTEGSCRGQQAARSSSGACPRSVVGSLTSALAPEAPPVPLTTTLQLPAAHSSELPPYPLGCVPGAIAAASQRSENAATSHRGGVDVGGRPALGPDHYHNEEPSHHQNHCYPQQRPQVKNKSLGEVAPLSRPASATALAVAYEPEDGDVYMPLDQGKPITSTAYPPTVPTATFSPNAKPTVRPGAAQPASRPRISLSRQVLEEAGLLSGVGSAARPRPWRDQCV